MTFLCSTTLLAGGIRYALSVDGLACPFCAYGIEKRLNRVPGIEQVETDVSSGRVIITVSDDEGLTEKAARRAVEEAGFTLRAFANRWAVASVSSVVWGPMPRSGGPAPAHGDVEQRTHC